MSPRPFLMIALLAAGAPVAAVASGPAINTRSLNAGYGRDIGDENRPVATSSRDSQGNRVIVNGLLSDSTGLGAGLGASAETGLNGGLGQGFAGAGVSMTASAAANQINIVANGSWNTIIVDATQTNTGAVTATNILK